MDDDGPTEADSPLQQWYGDATEDGLIDGASMDVGVDSAGATGSSDGAIDIDAIFDDSSTEERRIVASVVRGVDVTEIYSPARVNKLATKMGLVPGHSLDLTNTWDFSKA